MSSESIEAIDVHAHYGRHAGGGSELECRLMSASADQIVERARCANSRLTVVSPFAALMPRLAADPVSGNLDAARVVGETERLLQWVVLDPLKPDTYLQAEEMLRTPKCVGLKIHPELHGYSLTEQGRPIFEFAAAHAAVTLAHSGERNSMPEDFAELADEFADVKLIVSHLGYGWDNDLTHQVRAVQSSKHGNVWTDTSSVKSIMPGLIEWAVAEVGAERILFGSDSPCYSAPMQRARIDTADLSADQKRLILHDNAAELLGLR